MKFLFNIGMAVLLTLPSGRSMAQIQNTITENVKINGNCGMCKAAIEKAGNVKNVSGVDWSDSTKVAAITYDKTKTTRDAILKRIALAGYDSDEYLAPDEAYAALPACCRYARNKLLPVSTPQNSDTTHLAVSKEFTPFDPFYKSYFALTDALVASDSKTAAASANAMLKAIDVVDMEKLNAGIHQVWMAEIKSLRTAAAKIAAETDIDQQRLAFMNLAEPVRKLAKVSTPGTLYYQHCPMANSGKGADWLSRENAIKNPYYGVQMLTCGKTVETIQ